MTEHRLTIPEGASADTERFDVTIGSYPGEHVRLKVQSADAEEATTAAAWLHDRVDVVEPADEPGKAGSN